MEEKNKPNFPETTNTQKGDLFADFKPSQTQTGSDLFAASADTSKNEEIIFTEEEKYFAPVKPVTDSWKMLIVDDEEDVHEITTLVLGSYTFKNKPLEIMNAYSAEQAKTVLDQHHDVAVVLLDVVMETHDAGLQLVLYIREHLHNPFTRIILRTGQPGYAPEEKVILEYEISDYANKTELSRQKLITITTASLRSYADIMTVESYRQNLEEKVRQRTQELQDKNQELTLLNEQLVALNTEKSEFLGIAAHDLKSPLGNIFTLANMMASSFDSFDKERVAEYMEIIQNSAKRMFNLINSLLDVNAIESGKINIVCDTINILPVVRDVVTSYARCAQSKEITLHFQPPEFECVAYVDRDRAYQVLDNLVSNAVKYSPSNTQVHIQVARQTDWVYCTIQDQGPGLDAEEQTKLFSKFARLSPRPTANEPSTGLGLFVVKRLVEMLKGNVWCESKKGEGSTFIVTFPIPRAE